MSRVLLCALLGAMILPATAHADRRYFVQSYTPYLAPAGNLELENTTAAFSGQGDSSGTAWSQRFEFEYGASDRLTAALYLNFIQPAGEAAAMTFDGPSLELIWRLAEPGRLPVDPAAYFEVRANGAELELEPKLLLARRVYQLVTTVNVVGEIEHHLSGPEKGEVEKSVRLTAGASREIGHVLAIGIESVYTRGFADEGPDASSVLLGPTVNLQTAKVQASLGWHPQLKGWPSTSGGRNLDAFPRSEVRMIVGVEL